jgi:hypothetical protein
MPWKCCATRSGLAEEGFMDVLANGVIALHLAYFVFVLGGFVALIIGIARREEWIYNPWFRIVHFVAVAVVLFEDVLQLQCPLNTLQTHLQSPNVVETPGTVGNFLDWLLHHTISERALDVIYWTIGGISLVLFVVRPPRFLKK